MILLFISRSNINRSEQERLSFHFLAKTIVRLNSLKSFADCTALSNWRNKTSWLFMNMTSKTKDQFISIYFFGPLSSFPNITARTITRAEEKAKRNINILSSPKVYHSMIIPSYIRFQDGFTNYGLNGRELLKVEWWTFHCGLPWKQTKFFDWFALTVCLQDEININLELIWVHEWTIGI